MVNYNYYFQIAGLTVGIQSPVPVAFRPCMEPFQIASAEAVDLCYEIRQQSSRSWCVLSLANRQDL